MHEDLILLQQADGHDRAAGAADVQRTRLRGKRTDAEQAVDDAANALQDVQKRMAELRTHELSLKRSMETAQTYRARATKALEMGLGDADAAERQHAQTSEQIDEIETQQLQAMEAADALVAEQAARQQALEAAQAALAALLTTFDEAIAGFSATIRAEDAKRDEVLDQLPKEHRHRYDDLRAKNRWAVATILQEACDACYKVIRQQHVSDIRRGIIAPCLGCGRYLVVQD